MNINQTLLALLCCGLLQVFSGTATAEAVASISDKDEHVEITPVEMSPVDIVRALADVSIEVTKRDSEPQTAPVQTAPAGESNALSHIGIEALEQELMSLNADLMILEEDLLYPASSRVAVYLSMDMGDLFRLDAVTLKLNGEEVTHHLYTQREVSALYRGGVQKLYVGNARQGKNELTAFFTGMGPHERDYKRGTSVSFEHSFEPIYVELSINDVASKQQPEFSAIVR
ncbi:MAG: hypothetical protein ABGY96_27235 [bacterium]